MLVLSVKPDSKIHMGGDTTVLITNVLDDSIYASINDSPPRKISYQPIEITPNNIIRFQRRRKQSNVARIELSSPGRISREKT